MLKTEKYFIFIHLLCLILIFYIGYKQSNPDIVEVEIEVEKEVIVYEYIEIETEAETIEETTTKKKIEETTKRKSVNNKEFVVTAYCGCKECNGQWYGYPTASGTNMVANHTIAVDTNIIPFGTQVEIDGIIYTAEDTGSAIKGNKIDIYFDSHSEALKFGRQTKIVNIL